MYKKLPSALVALFVLSTLIVSPAQAVDTSNYTLAILDTGLDTSTPEFSGKIAQEACFSQYQSCPNKSNFMEGTGSAYVPKSWSDTNAVWKHGTEMASAAIQTNPNMKILPVRVYSMVMLKDKVTYGTINPTQDRVALALNWVYDNRTKYSIRAVSAPLGFYYARACTVNNNIRDAIIKLNSANIAVSFSSGNNWDYKFTNEPSCIPEAISVAGLMPDGTVGTYSNLNGSVDFAANGTMMLTIPGGGTQKEIGTSVAVVVFGAEWVKIAQAKPNLTYQQEYDLIKSTSRIAIQGNLSKSQVAGTTTTASAIDSIKAINLAQ
jgi:Subtilase family